MYNSVSVNILMYFLRIPKIVRKSGAMYPRFTIPIIVVHLYNSSDLLT